MLIDEVLFWNKMESLSSDIGSNFTQVGTVARQACKFNNGGYSNNNANYFESPDDAFDPNEFMIEYWFKSDWNAVNAVPQSSGTFKTFFTWYKSNADRIHFNIDRGGSPGIYLAIKSQNVNNFQFWTPASMDWSAGTLVHLLWVYKRAGIGATSNTKRLYYNGALVASTNSIPFEFLVSDGGMTYLNHSDHGRTIESNMDNIKIYKSGSVTEANITEILANRENEGFPVSGRPFLNKLNRAAGVAA